MVKEGFGKLVSLKEAIEILESNINTLPVVKVKIDEALGRSLAEDIIAPIDVPHFDKSAMDGYAVIARDTFGASNTSPKYLKSVGSISPGQVFQGRINQGECAEISTGAPLPDGADGVVMVEYTERAEDSVIIYKSIAPEENVVKIGSDIKKGERVIEKGTLLGPRHIGALTAMGISEVSVYKKPCVAILTTGDEIIRLGDELKKGKVYDINSYTISSALIENNCDVINLGVVPDDKTIIKEKILEGIEKGDILLLSGGSSLGAGDFIHEVISEIGVILIHGIAVKPGKPTTIAKVKDRLIIGLPGHPTSCLSNVYILVLPIIRKMQGDTKPVVERTVEAILTRKVASTIGRYEFLSVKLFQKEDGIYAEPIMKGSSSITTLASADGFVGIDENIEVLEKGDKVKVRLF